LRRTRRWSVLLLGFGLMAGCGGRGRNASIPPRPLTPEGVNALRPGLREEEIIAALGPWEARQPDLGQGLSQLEYAALANHPGNGTLVLEIMLKKGALVQANLRDATSSYLCECRDVFHQADPHCQANWASSCLALLDPAARICAPADGPPEGAADEEKIDLLWDPPGRRPADAEGWARQVKKGLVDMGIHGRAAVHLAWRSDGWRVQSACVRSRFAYADRLPPWDMRREVAEMLQLPHSAGSDPPATAASAHAESIVTSSGTVRSISGTFSAADLKLLDERLNGPPFQDRLRAYTCGEPAPGIAFTVSITEAAAYQERQVLIQPHPDPSPLGRQRCLLFGLGYELDREISALDRGEPTNHRRKPSSPPLCDCAKRDSGQEWVTWPVPAASASQ